MLDYKILNRVASVGDFARAEEEFQMKKAAALADIAKAGQFDLKKSGQEALYRQALGEQLTPEQKASLDAMSALAMSTKVNPVSGEQYYDKDPRSFLGMGNSSQGVPMSPMPSQSGAVGLPRAFDMTVGGGASPQGNPGLALPVPGGNKNYSPKTQQALEQERALKELGFKVDFPQTQFQSENLVRQVAELKEHPGMSAVVGAKGPSTWLTNINPLGDRDQVTGIKKPMGGSDAASFNARLGQVKSGAFLDAYKNYLKGTGQITEIEGSKATQALQRLDAAQSEEEFNAAADEFILQTKAINVLVKQKAGIPLNQQDIDILNAAESQQPRTFSNQENDDINNLINLYAGKND
jgi:hypothetical protein